MSPGVNIGLAIVSLLKPIAGVQEYLYVPVPPDTKAFNVVLLLSHISFAVATTSMLRSPPLVSTFTSSELEHSLLSLFVAVRVNIVVVVRGFVIVDIASGFSTKSVGSQWNVYLSVSIESSMIAYK